MKRVLLALLTVWIVLAAAGALAQEDGVFAPEEFTFSGGSGKVVITCPQVTVTGGEAEAKIVFSSPNYPRAMVGDTVYESETVDGQSVFVLPAPLGRAFTVTATTTAMSQPHDIEYTLFIRLGGEDAVGGLARVGSMDLVYAEGFSVEYYEGGYALIRVKDAETYLVVPEGMDAPEGLDPSVIVLKKPFERVYMAATSAMALFDSMDALGSIRLSGTRQDGWYVQRAADAMERGDILFAGKYSEPDFELLVRENCDLAIESMMILHTPQVRELITLLGIPVFIDRSSNEPHPLGRVEWIRLYGLLMDRDEEAKAAFEAQAEMLHALPQPEGERKTVAFFALKPDGTVTVRGSGDYIARSIDLAGGKYVFDGMGGEDSTSASVNITMEAFYEAAAQADFIVYNAAIETPAQSVESLIAMQPLFSDFKAVKEGNVWCANRWLYQATDGIGTFIKDLRAMLEGQEEGMTFLYRLPGR